MTSSWFFLSTLNYDARSTTHQIPSRCVSPLVPYHIITSSYCSSVPLNNVFMFNVWMFLLCRLFTLRNLSPSPQIAIVLPCFRSCCPYLEALSFVCKPRWGNASLSRLTAPRGVGIGTGLLASFGAATNRKAGEWESIEHAPGAPPQRGDVVRRAAAPTQNTQHQNLKKGDFCRYDEINSFTWFTLQPKLTTEIKWWLVH